MIGFTFLLELDFWLMDSAKNIKHGLQTTTAEFNKWHCLGWPIALNFNVLHAISCPMQSFKSVYPTVVKVPDLDQEDGVSSSH